MLANLRYEIDEKIETKKILLIFLFNVVFFVYKCQQRKLSNLSCEIDKKRETNFILLSVIFLYFFSTFQQHQHNSYCFVMEKAYVRYFTSKKEKFLDTKEIFSKVKHGSKTNLIAIAPLDRKDFKPDETYFASAIVRETGITRWTRLQILFLGGK